MISHLLLAVDVDTSSQATRVAGDLAAASGAAVEVFHADELNTRIDTAIWLDDDTEPREEVGNAVAELNTRGITARVVTTRTTSTKDLAKAVLHEGLELDNGHPHPRPPEVAPCRSDLPRKRYGRRRGLDHDPSAPGPGALTRIDLYITMAARTGQHQVDARA